MYKIDKVQEIKTFTRSFEEMGKGLVLLKVEAKVKNIGYNYHLFYRNGKKPPLDVAVHPEYLLVEYASFFLQDELIKLGPQILDIEFQKENLRFLFDNLSVDNTHLDFQNDFDALLMEDYLVILEKGFNKKIFAYFLDVDNYILMDEGDNIIGLCFKNILSGELDILKEVEVL